ncbi:neurogenic locus notch homolog protein 1 [Strongylocentrotus purpuratus]|uniref:Uncharacterized protein n=1 Tax=Strongylocentrotus purpuratus TaxID=7668 RepID=A0A7M7PPC2_STRPU|nr:neurogenic locus notch homolog protein 1 [Strongylocentrotus purpuratus]
MPEIDPCLSSPCGNGGDCSSSNAVYLCTCPDTHEGTNCETAKTGCSSNTGCPTRESCNSDTNMCECSGNSVRNANGVCRVPRRTLSLSIVIVEFQSTTDFQAIVNNPTSVASMDVRQRLTIIIFAIYRTRYGPIFIGVVIRGFSLGSLEVDADLMFDEPESPTTIQPPTAVEAAQEFTESLGNGNSTGEFVLVPSRTTVTDIDECSSSTLNDCSSYAECTNTEGSFTCACQEGFIDTTPAPDSGRQCEDMNECSDASICAQSATCSNSFGSYSCSCLAGFTGDGRTCTSVGSAGLSDGVLAGIIIGSVVIIFLIFFLFVALFIRMRQMMSHDRRLGRSISRLAPLDREREAMPFGNGNGYYGDGYPMADYPSNMELGHMRKPGYSNGVYTTETTYNEGFVRPYMAPSGKIESVPVHDQYY